MSRKGKPRSRSKKQSNSSVSTVRSLFLFVQYCFKGELGNKAASAQTKPFGLASDRLGLTPHRLMALSPQGVQRPLPSASNRQWGRLQELDTTNAFRVCKFRHKTTSLSKSTKQTRHRKHTMSTSFKTTARADETSTASMTEASPATTWTCP